MDVVYEKVSISINPTLFDDINYQKSVNYFKEAQMNELNDETLKSNTLYERNISVRKVHSNIGTDMWMYIYSFLSLPDLITHRTINKRICAIIMSLKSIFWNDMYHFSKRNLFDKVIIENKNKKENIFTNPNYFDVLPGFIPEYINSHGITHLFKYHNSRNNMFNLNKYAFLRVITIFTIFLSGTSCANNDMFIAAYNPKTKEVTQSNILWLLICAYYKLPCLSNNFSSFYLLGTNITNIDEHTEGFDEKDEKNVLNQYVHGQKNLKANYLEVKDIQAKCYNHINNITESNFEHDDQDDDNEDNTCYDVTDYCQNSDGDDYDDEINDDDDDDDDNDDDNDDADVSDSAIDANIDTNNNIDKDNYDENNNKITISDTDITRFEKTGKEKNKLNHQLTIDEYKKLKLSDDKIKRLFDRYVEISKINEHMNGYQVFDSIDQYYVKQSCDSCGNYCNRIDQIKEIKIIKHNMIKNNFIFDFSRQEIEFKKCTQHTDNNNKECFLANIIKLNIQPYFHASCCGDVCGNCTFIKNNSSSLYKNKYIDSIHILITKSNDGTLYIETKNPNIKVF